MRKRIREIFFDVIKLGTPLAVTGYSSVLMILTDAYMIGKLGTEELAAITPAGLLVSLLLIMITETLTSVNTFASTTIGMKQNQEAGNYLWQGVYTGILYGLLALSLIPAARLIFQTFLPEVGDRVLELEVVYFKICLLMILPMAVSSALTNYFVACGQSVVSMLSSIGAVALNIVLNAILIFGWRQFPAMGFEGSAWGTAIASWAQMVFLLAWLLWSKRLRTYGSLWARFSWQRTKQLLSVGLHCGVQGAIDLFSWGILLAWLIGQFGYKHLAAQTILSACIRFSFAPAAGIGNALATFVGRAAGEKNFLLARQTAQVSFRVILIYMSCMAVFFYFCRYPIMRLFTDDAEVIALGVQGMIYVAAFQYFDAMNVAYINALQGVGDTAWPTAMQIILTAVVLLGGGLLMVNFLPHWHSVGVWMVAALYVAIQGILFRWRWTCGQWRRIRLIDTTPATAL